MNAIPIRVLEPEEVTKLKNGDFGPTFTFTDHDRNTTFLICEWGKEYVVVMDDEPVVACRGLTTAMNWILARV